MESISTSRVSLKRSPDAWLKRHYAGVKWSIAVLSAWPAIALYLDYTGNSLGANPLQALQQVSGEWAMIFLFVTLAITPMRRVLSTSCRYVHARYGKRLADWNWIIRLRRMLGLYCFFYAAVHLMLWLHFDIGYDWQWLGVELAEKPYLLAGAIAFLLLIPLAITSNNASMRYLGRNWRRLHRLVYVISLLVVAHYWLSVKPGDPSPWPYTSIILLLLLYRILANRGWLLRKPRDDGMEVDDPVRPGGYGNRRISTSED